MQEELIERFFRYTGISSQSDASVAEVPTSAGQWELARLLEGELRELGFSDVHVSEHACLTAKLPATDSSRPAMGFCAHLDTVDVNLSPDIHPQIFSDYRGGALELSPTVTLDPAEHPEILAYVGDDIICTDGTSVLGADDKAAISSIMTALHAVVEGNLPHGDLYVAFLPDEEIGLRGAKKLDLAHFPVTYAYTLDSCEIGEIVYQTFNAGSALLEIEGVSAHPMSAKGVLVNPVLVANDFITMFNRLETPENTEGTEGYIWIQGIAGNQARASVEINIRDHSKARYRERKAYIEQAVELLKARHPRARISLTMSDVYSNIHDAVTEDNRAAIDNLEKAFADLGIKPKVLAMRGGTDGSYLSSQGLLTPNFFTGAHNFHSPFEFLPVKSFVKSCEVILKLIELAE